MVITSDKEPAPWPHNELPSKEQPKQSLSINPCISSSQATMKEAAEECSKSAPAAEQAIEHHETNRTQLLHSTAPSSPISSAEPHDQASRQAIKLPSMLDIETSAAPGVVEQKVVEEAANHPEHAQTHNNSGGQKQCPRPRQVCNVVDHVQQNNTRDAFGLCTRYYPTCTSTIDSTIISAASVQLLAAKEGLISGNQEGHLVPEGSHDMQHSNVLLEVPGCQVIHPPIPAPASYDTANPFTHPPQAEDILD
ncbi:hypothetical protein BKA83DRAFT_4126033 [Pisolithus microcarpus]|nr:hypothetical protein BKA83DRAFT_4126033 [Pisolithus microcarpus]